jgi:hypothetical protein
MISNSINETQRRLSALRSYVDLAEETNKFFATEGIDNDFFKSVSLKFSSLRERKILEYNSYIITLYGILENFLEDLVEEYLRVITKAFPKYNTLPKKICDNNRSLSIEFFSRIDRGRFKGYPLESLLSTLNSSFVQNTSHIVYEAFRIHSSNFRYDSIITFLERIGISNCLAEVLDYPPLRKYFEKDYAGYKKHELNPILKGLTEDLAEKRNEVAHGLNYGNILSPAIVLDIINFIEALAVSLNLLLADNYLILIEPHNSIMFEIEKLFPKPNVIGGRLHVGGLKIGDTLYIKRTSRFHPKFIPSQITGIVCDHKEVTDIEGNPNLQCGLKMSSDIRGAESIIKLPNLP